MKLKEKYVFIRSYEFTREEARGEKEEKKIP